MTPPNERAIAPFNHPTPTPAAKPEKEIITAAAQAEEQLYSLLDGKRAPIPAEGQLELANRVVSLRGHACHLAIHKGDHTHRAIRISMCMAEDADAAGRDIARVLRAAGNWYAEYVSTPGFCAIWIR